LQTSAAYLLFYRRRTERPFGGKTLEVVQSAIDAAPPVPEQSTSSLPQPTEADLIAPADNMDDDGHLPDPLTMELPIRHRFQPPSSSADTDLSSTHVSSSDTEDSDASHRADADGLEDDFSMMGNESGWDSWAGEDREMLPPSDPFRSRGVPGYYSPYFDPDVSWNDRPSFQRRSWDMDEDYDELATKIDDEARNDWTAGEGHPSQVQAQWDPIPPELAYGSWEDRTFVDEGGKRVFVRWLSLGS
jgi:hypothetical protein